jgi:hypothetical protein
LGSRYVSGLFIQGFLLRSIIGINEVNRAGNKRFLKPLLVYAKTFLPFASP